MNGLEETILSSVEKVQDEYEYVSDGWWLYHAPESFIQSHLASRIARKGEFCVFPECSPKRWKDSVNEEDGAKPRGRPFSAHNTKRFDLVIWFKSGKRPRAIVEIKRATNVSPLLADVKKILKYKKEAQSFGIRTAYILVYSEAKRNTKRAPFHSGRKKLEKRFKEWEDALVEKCDGKAVSCVGVRAHEPQGQDRDWQWSWGVALYRVDYTRARKRRPSSAVFR